MATHAAHNPMQGVAMTSSRTESRLGSFSERTSNVERDFATEYDFCIVLPLENGFMTARGTGYLNSLTAFGFESYVYIGVEQDTEAVVLLRAPLDLLRSFADKVDFKLLLNPTEIQRRLENGDAEHGIAPVSIADCPDVTHYKPYQYIYGKYSRNTDESLYWREVEADHPFRELIRLKLSALIMSSRSGRSENIKIRRCLQMGWMKACFPLHNQEQVDMLRLKWKGFPWQRPPLDDMKEYFGEKVALYYVFMHHFMLFLTIPAVVGIPLQLVVFSTNDYSAPYLPFYSFFVALWAVCMLEFWKRREKSVALSWGMIDFELTEVDRAEFRGERITSFVDGSEIRYFASKRRRRLLIQSFTSVLVLIILVVGVVVSIYILRYSVSSSVGDSNAQTIASIANAVQIQVMNYLYSTIATALSERENHRTDTQFEDTMIAKIFWFQFVNSYASFFYLAFIADWMGDCPDSGCMSALTKNLAIIFATRLASSQIIELVLPYITYRFQYRKQMKQWGNRITRPEAEARLEKTDLIQAGLKNYAEIAIQYGYTALFVTALPMAAAYALISNIIDVKGDAFKVLKMSQRPFPKGAEDIGTWQTIFLIITVAAVITNAALTVFTMDTLNHFSFQLRMWIFIGFQWTCFTLQAMIMEIIPDVPEEIEVQLQRTEFIVDKLIDKVKDDEDG